MHRIAGTVPACADQSTMQSYLSGAQIESYRSVVAVKAKVIALYAVVLSNANHRRQNVRRAEANRICGWTAPLLKPLLFPAVDVRLFLSNVRAWSRDICDSAFGPVLSCPYVSNERSLVGTCDPCKSSVRAGERSGNE